MSKNKILNQLSFEFCTLSLPGRSPVAPGTMGSAAAALLAPLVFMPLNYGERSLVLVVLFFLGGIAATRVEQMMGKKDPGLVIIDEVLGQWLTYLPFATLSPQGFILGFVLFRVFDISKPWPIRRSEYWLASGYGVMVDDVVAGLYALLALWGLHAFWPGL